MNSKQVNLIRDAAISLENNDLQMAHDLMALAHEKRPKGKRIENKLNDYKLKLKPRIKLAELLKSGELAIIPAGFRCYTKKSIFKKLGFKQASLPFDSGFFSPFSIVSVLKNKKIELKYPDKENKTHDVCIKLENYLDINAGTGIKFKRATYDKINSLTKNKDQKGIHRYLDSTFGFYTVDNQNKFVLAHYNWHHFANKSVNKTPHEPTDNISNINVLLNNRIERMFNMCNQAKYVVFIYSDYKDYKHMSIDDKVYDLQNYEIVAEAATNTFGKKCIVANISEVDTANKLLNKIESQLNTNLN